MSVQSWGGGRGERRGPCGVTVGKRKRSLEDLGLDGRMVLEYILTL